MNRRQTPTTLRTIITLPLQGRTCNKKFSKAHSQKKWLLKPVKERQKKRKDFKIREGEIQG